MWPSVEIFEAFAPRALRDLVLVQGIEPSMRWRAFSAHLVDLAEALGVQVVVSLGALLGDVPHTRPVTMTGFASDPRWCSDWACTRSNYEGPTGIVGVLHNACVQAGPALGEPVGRAFPTMSPRPPTRRPRSRWCAGWKAPIGVSVDVSELESAAADYERQVGLAVQSDPDIQAFVERLEQAAEAEEERLTDRGPCGRHARPRIPALPEPARPRGEIGRERRAGDGGGATAPRPGRRCGSRRSSRRRARASARTRWRHIPSPTSEHGLRRPLLVVSPRQTDDLEVVEHVVVGLAGGLQLPVLARGQRIQRQLDVVLQLLGGPRARGLVVDQLVQPILGSLARQQPIDAIDAPAQMVRAEPEARTDARTTPALSPARCSRAW